MKQQLNRKKLTIGSWITIGHSTVAEIMAKAGFDWLAIDMEHSALSMVQCQELIRVIDLCGIPALVRVGANDPLLIKQAMDAGASGVIVPMVNSKEDAQRAVSAVKYPPQGTRGVGLSRAQGYGSSFNEYKEWLEKESVVIVQIEHINAVKHLKDILSVDGIDSFIIGPYDLSGSIGVPGDFEDERMKQAMVGIKEFADEVNMPAGYHVVSSDYSLVQDKIKDGYKFLVYGVDFLFLNEQCRNGLAQIKSMKDR